MDLDKLLNFIPVKQKMFAVPFFIILPVIYTDLFLFVDGYNNLPIFERVIFATAASIAYTFVCYFGIIISKTNAIIEKFVFIIISACIVPSFFAVIFAIIGGNFSINYLFVNFGVAIGTIFILAIFFPMPKN